MMRIRRWFHILLTTACSVAWEAANSQDGSFVSQIKRDVEPLGQSTNAILSYADVVEQARLSVVTIEVKRYKPQQRKDLENHSDLDFDLRGSKPPEPTEPDEENTVDGVGSGVIVTSQGLILTNHHVVENAAEIGVRLQGVEAGCPATLIGSDPSTDIALLQIQAPGPFRPAVVGDSAKVRSGDIVLAMGSPFGLEQTVTHGIVSATGRDHVGIIEGGFEDFIQTDAAINPGNSGGPLLDAKGRVIGMNTGRYWGQSIGFAVPINVMLKVASDLSLHGTVLRGQLGARCVELTPEIASSRQIPKRTKGAVVAEVQVDGPAATAGLMPGDVIKKINELRIDGRARLFMVLASLKPGDKVQLEVLRGPQLLQVETVLGEPTEAQRKAQPEVLQVVPGLKLGELTGAIRAKFLIPEDITGLVVLELFETSVKGQPLVAGDVVSTINGSDVDGVAAARDLLKHSRAAVIMLRVLHKGEGRFIAIPQEAKK